MRTHCKYPVRWFLHTFCGSLELCLRLNPMWSVKILFSLFHCLCYILIPMNHLCFCCIPHLKITQQFKFRIEKSSVQLTSSFFRWRADPQQYFCSFVLSSCWLLKFLSRTYGQQESWANTVSLCENGCVECILHIIAEILASPNFVFIVLIHSRWILSWIFKFIRIHGHYSGSEIYNHCIGWLISFFSALVYDSLEIEFSTEVAYC